jgi:mono/diheme cytochrome c family protein
MNMKKDFLYSSIALVTRLLIAISLFLASCNQSKKTDSQQVTDSTIADLDSSIVAQPTDSLSIDLLTLKDKRQIANTQVIKVDNDPVFHSAKSYKAIPLIDVLEKYTKIKSLNIKQTQIVFECEDGYNPSMDLSKVLSRKAFLAVADIDAPKGTDWTTIKKGSQEKNIAPFYVVYTNVTPEERDFKWPYNLVKISLVESAKEFAAVYPKDDDTMVKGYGLFQHNCMTCHALNKVGGTMGPELNYPKSVTEYWHSTDDIKVFIKNPTSFRNDCKMPAISYLTDKEIDEIIRYLQYMAKHKL